MECLPDSPLSSPLVHLIDPSNHQNIIMSAAFGPFVRAFRYLRYTAHEKPAVFWSFVIGATGPVMALTVPPIRKHYFGYVPPARIPKTYPLPDRPREEVTGYDD